MYNVQPVTKNETSKKISSHKQEVIKDPPALNEILTRPPIQ